MKYTEPDPLEPQTVPYGIVIAIIPKIFSFAVEMRRAPDDGTVNPNLGAVEVFDPRLYPKRGGIFLDELPNDNVNRFYSWRHVVVGGTPGAWTRWVGASPDVMPIEFPSDGSTIYPLNSDEPITGDPRPLSALRTPLVPNGDFEVWKTY